MFIDKEGAALAYFPSVMNGDTNAATTVSGVNGIARVIIQAGFGSSQPGAFAGELSTFVITAVNAPTAPTADPNSCVVQGQAVSEYR